MPSIRVVNLNKRYSKVVALDKVTFSVRNREYVGILGPSGCGKTTLIKCIAGIIAQDRGHVYIGEKMVDGVPPEDRGIGYVFQNIALFPHMNVRDNIGYGLRVKEVDEEESRRLVSEMIELIKFNADPKEYPRELSGGMQQKVAVARALASRTELLLLDEPLSALDAKVRVNLRYELRRLVKDLKLTAVHITHDQEEVMSIADRIIVMKRGQMVEIGTPTQLYFKPKRLFTANFLGEANFLEGKIIKMQESSLTIRIKGSMVIEVSLKQEEWDRKEREEGEQSDKLRTGEEKKFHTNQLIVAVIRPEFISISRGSGGKAHGGTNTLNATVNDAIFSGGTIRCDLTLEEGDRVACRMPFDQSEKPLRTGEELAATFDPNAILVYPYPRIGLAREVSLE
ncbi:MAG: ABC transporter ATP-binding protein [Candidatus Atabeyarchaeum deiterrae]